MRLCCVVCAGSFPSLFPPSLSPWSLTRHSQPLQCIQAVHAGLCPPSLTRCSQPVPCVHAVCAGLSPPSLTRRSQPFLCAHQGLVKAPVCGRLRCLSVSLCCPWHFFLWMSLGLDTSSWAALPGPPTELGGAETGGMQIPPAHASHHRASRLWCYSLSVFIIKEYMLTDKIQITQN